MATTGKERGNANNRKDYVHLVHRRRGVHYGGDGGCGLTKFDPSTTLPDGKTRDQTIIDHVKLKQMKSFFSVKKYLTYFNSLLSRSKPNFS